MVFRLELYDAILRPAVRIGEVLWQRGDRDTIDRFGPDGLSALVYRLWALFMSSDWFVFHCMHLQC